MSAFTIFLIIVAGVALLYGLLLGVESFYHYRPAQIVRCPETGRPVRVQLDATIAALTVVSGPTKLLVKHCELWPEREGCEQRCTRSLA
jgi:hypothetical protein